MGIVRSSAPGWKVVLTQRVPTVASAAVSPCFKDLVNSVPEIHKDDQPPIAANFDWALHPGGSLIITGVEQAMNLTPEHLRASYEIYMKYGNSSSATILSVLNKLRESEGKEHVVACAFGPGIALEMMVLRRREQEPSTSNGLERMDVHDVSNGNGATTHDAGSENHEAQTNNTSITTSKTANGHDYSESDCTAAEISVPGVNGADSNGKPTANGTSLSNGDSPPAANLPVEDLD